MQILEHHVRTLLTPVPGAHLARFTCARSVQLEGLLLKALSIAPVIPI